MREAGRIDLAASTPFHIGRMWVEPALRQISISSSPPETIEPRVMLVLVALGQAEGHIVSRDQLVEQCWDSRVVGDDSINRVISRLRRLSAPHSAKAVFTIDTISKVGYRLLVVQEATDKTDSPNVGLVPRQLAQISPTVPTSRRHRAAVLACGVVASVLAGLGWFVHAAGGAQAKPVVEVEPFTVAGGSVPPGLDMEVRAETAYFLANERLYSIAQDPLGGGSLRDWRVKGTIAPTEGGRHVVVFAQLFEPGSDIAVSELRVDRDAGQPMLARSIGLRVGRTSNCILLTVTDPDLTGGYTEAGLPALVDACNTWHDKGTSLPLRIDKFRAAASAFPHSSYFPARLAEMLGDMAADGSAGAMKLRAEGYRFVEAAGRNDPTQPHISLARAHLLPAFDFFGREAMLRKALAGRPSDCACEFGDYSNFLSMVGRNREARAFAERAHEKEPKNVPWLRRAGETAAIERDYETAHADLGLVAGFLPDKSSLDAWRMNLAIWSRDWLLAHAMNAREADLTVRTLQASLIDALASGNRERIDSAGRPYLARSRAMATNDRATVTALAMAGLSVPALDAADRLMSYHPLSLSVLFEPEFASARETPEFARLATKLGLVAYWRRSGRSPDFCRGSGVPAMCAGMNQAPEAGPVPVVEQ